MAILTANERFGFRRYIDLRGPAGNAYALLGQARAWAKQIGYTHDQIEALLEEMQESDYEHLISVFDREFGSFCDLIKDDVDEENDLFYEDF